MCFFPCVYLVSDFKDCITQVMPTTVTAATERNSSIIRPVAPASSKVVRLTHVPAEKAIMRSDIFEILLILNPLGFL